MKLRPHGVLQELGGRKVLLLHHLVELFWEVDLHPRHTPSIHTLLAQPARERRAMHAAGQAELRRSRHCQGESSTRSSESPVHSVASCAMERATPKASA